jgi:alpha-L-arabinofuranosidase
VKLVNTASDSTDIELVLDGATNSGTDAKATVLTSASPKDENSLSEPEKVSPESATIRFSGNVIKHPLPGNSFTVLRIPAGKTAHVPHSHEN